MTLIKKEFQYGDHKVTLETGEIARQADGAIMIDMDGTVVQCTVVGSRYGVEERDFFPMTVDYQEKTYAAGKIPEASSDARVVLQRRRFWSRV